MAGPVLPASFYVSTAPFVLQVSYAAACSATTPAALGIQIDVVDEDSLFRRATSGGKQAGGFALFYMLCCIVGQFVSVGRPENCVQLPRCWFRRRRG